MENSWTVAAISKQVEVRTNSSRALILKQELRCWVGLAEKKKVLVFAHHDAVLSALEEAVKKMQKRYIRIDGSHSAQERAKSMDMFQSDDKCRVALLSIKAAGVSHHFALAPLLQALLACAVLFSSTLHVLILV